MGKCKKPKTEHLSDAEIWDDSALLRSWDEAVAEYEVSYNTAGYFQTSAKLRSVLPQHSC